MRRLKNALQAGTLVGVAWGFSLAAPSIASANAPTELGGINVDGYCVSLGFASVTLIKGGVVGPNFAYDNWFCVDSSGGTHPVSMERACKAQYTGNAVVALASDPNSAFSWDCYAAGNAKNN